MRLFLVKDFIDLVFPRNCDLCGTTLFDQETCICSVCTGLLPVTSYHLRPFDNDLADKIKGLTEVNRVMAYLRFTKKGNSQKLLHELKYRNNHQLAVHLGRLYGSLLKENGFMGKWQCVIPVPLHPAKQKRRGYNQSEEFAKGLAEELKISVTNALSRKLFTSTQTKKSRLERMDNVENVFEFNEGIDLRDREVLLVDDVMTTGATLCACSNVLLSNDAKNVDLATIAAGGK